MENNVFLILTTMAYILAVALQVSGALILILFAMSTKRKSVIQQFANSHVITKNEDGSLKYNHEEFVRTYKNRLYTRCAVCFIAAGYGIGVFGDNSMVNRIVILICVIVAVALLIALSHYIIRVKTNNYSCLERITLEELLASNCDYNFEYKESTVVDGRYIAGETRPI